MSSTTDLPSRRRLLKMLGGAPLLPLTSYARVTTLLAARGGRDGDDTPPAPTSQPAPLPRPGTSYAGVTTLLAACGGSDDDDTPPAATYQSATFTGMAAPNLDNAA